jgi:recombination protein RecA
VRIDLRRVDSLKQGTEVIGSRCKAKIVKNKVAPPFRVAEFDIMFNQGISREGDLLDLAVEHNVVRKSGAFFSFGEMRLGQGRENAKEFLRQNPEIFNQIKAQVIAVAGGKAPVEPADEEAL